MAKKKKSVKKESFSQSERANLAATRARSRERSRRDAELFAKRRAMAFDKTGQFVGFPDTDIRTKRDKFLDSVAILDADRLRKERAARERRASAAKRATTPRSKAVKSKRAK